MTHTTLLVDTLTVKEAQQKRLANHRKESHSHPADAHLESRDDARQEDKGHTNAEELQSLQSNDQPEKQEETPVSPTPSPTHYLRVPVSPRSYSSRTSTTSSATRPFCSTSSTKSPLKSVKKDSSPSEYASLLVLMALASGPGGPIRHRPEGQRPHQHVHLRHHPAVQELPVSSLLHSSLQSRHHPDWVRLPDSLSNLFPDVRQHVCALLLPQGSSISWLLAFIPLQKLGEESLDLVLVSLYIKVRVSFLFPTVPDHAARVLPQVSLLHERQQLLDPDLCAHPRRLPAGRRWRFDGRFLHSCHTNILCSLLMREIPLPLNILLLLLWFLNAMGVDEAVDETID